MFHSASNSAPILEEAWTEFEYFRRAKDVLKAEIQAAESLAKNIPHGFAAAVEKMVDCSGSVIVMGIGKAGWIGQKVSASLASTGTCSHFLHPSEAMHGDLGRIAANDIVLIFSNSGNTPELVQLLPPLKRRCIPIIAVSGSENNEVASAAEIVLAYGAVTEACHLGLAPSTSTTMMLLLGDALCLVAAQRRNFTPGDFVRYHPGGSLGLKLSRVEEVMRPLRQCRVAESQQTVRQVFTGSASRDRRSGAVLIVQTDKTLCGLFTDSDLARLLEQQRDDCFDKPIADVMTCNPKKITFGSATQTAVDLLSKHDISELPVVDLYNRPVGMIDITDVLKLLPKSSA